MVRRACVSKKNISNLNSQFLIHRPPSAGLNCLENDCTTNLVYFLSNMGSTYMQELNKAWLTLHNSFYYWQKAFGKILLADFTTTGSNVVEARARASKRRTCALTQKRVYNRIVYLFPVRVTFCRQQLLEQCHNITQHNISLWNEKNHLKKFGKSERKIKEVKS